MIRSKQRGYKSADIWPGFVDALSALLIVIIFTLLTFVVSQFFLSDALSSRDEALANLKGKVDSLLLDLKGEQNLKIMAEGKIKEFFQVVNKLERQLIVLKKELVVSNDSLKDSEEQRKSGILDIKRLKDEVAKLNLQLQEVKDAFGIRDEESIQMAKQNKTLAETLAIRINELRQIKDKLLTLQDENQALDHKVHKLEKLNFNSFNKYRSEFFAKLQKAIGNRKDIHVVGDRFIFQSEILFRKGSAELGGAGKVELKKLANALQEISKRIPGEVNWILRIDGHTDTLPIHNRYFASNWHLSSSRAIAVVQFLVSQGIPQTNLAPTGFAENHPLDDGSSENALAKNRRIEFKLDQR